MISLSVKNNLTAGGPSSTPFLAVSSVAYPTVAQHDLLGASLSGAVGALLCVYRICAVLMRPSCCRNKVDGCEMPMITL